MSLTNSARDVHSNSGTVATLQLKDRVPSPSLATRTRSPTKIVDGERHQALVRRAQPLRRHESRVLYEARPEVPKATSFLTSNKPPALKETARSPGRGSPPGTTSIFNQTSSRPVESKKQPQTRVSTKQEIVSGDAPAGSEHTDDDGNDSGVGPINYFMTPVEVCPSPPTDEYSPSPAPQYQPFDPVPTPSPPPELRAEVERMKKELAAQAANNPQKAPSPAWTSPPRSTPPLYSPRYPPSPTLIGRHPDTWLDEILVSVERRRRNLQSELADATRDMKDALTESMKALILLKEELGSGGLEGLLQELEEGKGDGDKVKEKADGLSDEEEGQIIDFMRFLRKMVGTDMVRKMIQEALDSAEADGESDGEDEDEHRDGGDGDGEDHHGDDGNGGDDSEDHNDGGNGGGSNDRSDSPNENNGGNDRGEGDDTDIDGDQDGDSQDGEHEEEDDCDQNGGDKELSKDDEAEEIFSPETIDEATNVAYTPTPHIPFQDHNTMAMPGMELPPEMPSSHGVPPFSSYLPPPPPPLVHPAVANDPYGYMRGYPPMPGYACPMTPFPCYPPPPPPPSVCPTAANDMYGHNHGYGYDPGCVYRYPLFQGCAYPNASMYAGSYAGSSSELYDSSSLSNKRFRDDDYIDSEPESSASSSAWSAPLPEEGGGGKRRRLSHLGNANEKETENEGHAPPPISAQHMAKPDSMPPYLEGYGLHYNYPAETIW